LPEGTLVSCPHCGNEQHLGLVLENTTFLGHGTNIAVTCGSCNRIFDAAPGDGTFSTINNRFQMIRTAQEAARLILEEDLTVAGLDHLRRAFLARVETGAAPSDIAEQIHGFESLNDG
jgi:hypothetical protein